MASPPSRAIGARPTLSAGVGAAPGPSYWCACCVSTCPIALTYASQLRPGLFPGLGEALDSVGDLAVEHMGIACRGLEVGVVKRPLHEPDVASLAQQLGAEVVPEIVEAEAGHASTLAQITPVAFYAVEGDGIAPALSAAAVVALRHVGEDV